MFDILVTFVNGRTIHYTTDNLALYLSDSDIQTIIDMRTGEIIK